MLAKTQALIFYICLAGLLGCSAKNDEPLPVDPACDSADRNEPHALPSAPTLSQDRFLGADTCGGCHPNHFRQWKQSAHGHAMTDPVFRALVAKMQEETPAGTERYCTQCHSAIGTRSCDIKPGFKFEELSKLTLEGVTCEACHKVSGLERTYNSGHVIEEVNVIYAPQPPDGPIQPHPVQVSDLHAQPDFCGGCHDVKNKDLTLESPFQEWLSSPARFTGDTCQKCHMPTYEGRRANFDHLPVRNDIHQHRFVGVDTFLHESPDSPDAPILRQQVNDLLLGAGEVSLLANFDPQQPTLLRLMVNVENKVAGHNLPTGSTFFRQLWVHLQVLDANGQVLFETGHLDAAGDLQDDMSTLQPNEDPALMVIGSTLLTMQGHRTFYPWEAVALKDGSLRPEESRSWPHDVSLPSEPSGPLRVHAKLLFRAFPPHMVRSLGLPEVEERLEIMTLHETTLEVRVDRN